MSYQKMNNLIDDYTKYIAHLNQFKSVAAYQHMRVVQKVMPHIFFSPNIKYKKVQFYILEIWCFLHSYTKFQIIPAECRTVINGTCHWCMLKQQAVSEFMIVEKETVVNIHKHSYAVCGSLAVDRNTTGC